MSSRDWSKDEGDEQPAVAEEKTIQRDVAPGKSTKADADRAVNKALAGAGSGVAGESGATFHDDATSHAAADALGARAFTAGSDVYFGAGHYAPGTDGGDALISHELTHVDQGKGVTPPKPGDFRVSSPGDASEVAARDGAAGATASPSTIMRDDETEPATTGTGPAAGPGGEAGAGGDAGAGEESDPYEDWKAAVNGFDRADAVSKWAAVPPADKKKAKDEDRGFRVRIVYVMKKDSVEVVKDSGIPIADIAGHIFLSDEFTDFLVPLRTHGLLNGFLDAGPQGRLVDDDKVDQLKTWIDATASRTEAKRIFEKPYPELHDAAPGAVSFGGTAAAWPLSKIKRLYTVLAQYLDPGHVSTITGGFVYVSNKGFGWWSPSQRRVFLPNSSDAPGGHSMTGGVNRGHHATDPKDKKGRFTKTSGRSVSPDFTGADGKKKTGGAAEIGHFTGTILHEVGHGVGARLDGGRGNAYAEDSGSWPGFHVRMDLDDWANELWSSAAAAGAEPNVDSDAKLSPDKAKDFFKAELQNGKGAYDAGWGSEPPRDDIARYVKWRYANVPLQMWWNYFIELKNPKASAYAWDDEAARLKGNWCYAYLTRGSSHYSKFRDHTWQKKVSWYSLSSPREWFAEQYAHYYRTEKTGSGLDADTAQLLKELDEKQFAPTDAVDEGGVTIADSTGGSADGGGGSDDDAGIGEANPADTSAEAAASEQAGESEEDVRPLMFPW